ncbi:TPA: UV DNA damage repair endonuclease UvsE [Candidatus Woesearchaeota archaeon]|nr:UV DNA damage repair endonuclease UvsE [Candidatus Woesearchaeota archaeon]
MKIGYPCINTSIGCTANSTFRLASYSEERLIETVDKNIDCLMKILRWNKEKGIMFFRIGSGIVPFASHPICRFNWQRHFLDRFRQAGELVDETGMRVSTHPDQFIVLNSPDKDIVKRSIAELQYHADFMDAMGLSGEMKIQLHVGGVYGDRESAMQRFAKTYRGLSESIKKRLVIEDDERMYSVKDCLKVSRMSGTGTKAGIPVIVDTLHHSCNNNGESIREAIESAAETWRKKDGTPIVDYSTQAKGEKKGKHAEHIDINDFKGLLEKTKGLDFDIMLEIKDKEKSALKALEVVR